MGRHRHVACVRTDGLSAILRPLLDDTRVVGATLVDVGSGLVLDGFADTEDLGDLELVGAGHAEMVAAAAMLRGDPHVRPDTEVTVDTGDGRLHVVASVADPHGDHLVVAVVVRGAARHAARVRRQLREVPVEALTAGPSHALRPVDGRWLPASDPAAVATTAPSADGVAPDPAPPHPTGSAWFGPEPSVPAWTLSEPSGSGSAWSGPAPSGPAPSGPAPSGDGDDAPADDHEAGRLPGPVAPAPPAAMIPVATPDPVLPPVADALHP